MKIGFILSLIFAGIVGLFALNNGGKVPIDLFLINVEISQAIVIFISAFLGAIIVAILGWIKDLKYKKEIRSLKKDKDYIEEEKNKLLDELHAKELQIKSFYEINTEIPIIEELDKND